MALGPLYATIPPATVGVPYTFQVQQADVIAAFVGFFGPAANLPPYTFVSFPPYGIPLADFITGLAIPGMTISSTGLIFGTPTTAGHYIPICGPESALNPSPPPLHYSSDTIVVNGWDIVNPGNRSYPIF